jgi:ribosomal protein S18 acetylase RimI-like enzyme
LFSIRRADVADAELIARLSRQTFIETFAEHNSAEDMKKFLNCSFSQEKLVNEVGEPGNTFLLAYEGDKPVGYAKLSERKKIPELNESDAIEIARIYSVKSSLGMGVGKMLMEECMAIAIANKKTCIWLGVWEHNQRAIDFYTKWGFEKFSTHVFMLGDDAQTDWLMKKQLLS